MKLKIVSALVLALLCASTVQAQTRKTQQENLERF